VDDVGDDADDIDPARVLTCADDVHRVWTRNCGRDFVTLSELR
jgi:hypothetical protein